MPPTRCPNCDVENYGVGIDPGAGTSWCMHCGCLIEENAIVAEVTFGETSGGAAIVQGSHVAAGATRAKINAPWGKQGNVESMDQAKAKARQILNGLKRHLGINEEVAGIAERWWILAYTGGFTKGRKALLVIGGCCYIAIRQRQKPIMLIDMSDLLQVNVFELGTVYLQLMQVLAVKGVMLIEPELYIERFSKLLEFGEDRLKIRDDAVRIVQRFKRDWLHTGRRPSGICGAAILLAARMNNYRRSVLEIVQVVKIADTTLRKRLEEFGKTPSADFTLDEFNKLKHEWLAVEAQNPPSFTKGLEKTEKEKLAASGKENKIASGKKRKRGHDDEGESVADTSAAVTPAPSSRASSSERTPARDKRLLRGDMILGEQSFSSLVNEALGAEPLFLPDEPTRGEGDNGSRAQTSPPPLHTIQDPTELIDSLISSEVTQALRTEADDPVIARSLALADKLDQERLQRMKASPTPFGEDGELLVELDEEELDMYINTAQEVEAKERVWVEINRQYLEECAAKEAAAQGESQPPPKKRKPNGKRVGPRDSTTARGATPAESAFALMSGSWSRKRSANAPQIRSKRINYDALKKLFSDDRKPLTFGELGSPSSKGKAGIFKGAPETEAEDDEDEDEEMEAVEEDGPPYRGLAGLGGRDAEYDYGEEMYDDGGWQEEV